MARMSSGAGDPKRLRLSDFFVRIAVPAAAAVAVGAIVTSSAHEIDDELQLIAPDVAVVGEPLPLRARLYSGLKRAEGPRLVTAPVELELRTLAGRILGRARFGPAFGGSLEATLRLPSDFRGDARLRARVTVRGASVRCERALRIVERATPESAQPVEVRRLPPLQQFASGPVKPRDAEQPAPDALALAIRGGACVPEQPCALFVHVGAPAAALRVIANAAVTPDAASARASPVTEGVVPLRVVTHGPEAELTLVAEREGVEVARRAFRLAIALGAQVARELPPVLDANAVPALGLLGDETGCLVDAFHDQHWLRAGTLATCRGDELLPFAALEPGPWRLQLRRDAFGSNSAAVVSVYVQRESATGDEAIARLAAAVRARVPDDALARQLALAPPASPSEFTLTVAYLLARLDDGVVALPLPVSGLPLAELELFTARAKLRRLALLAIVLCALTLASIVAQRGLSAAAQATQLMADVGEEPERLARQRVRMLLRVFSTVSTLLLAFVVIALYVVFRTQAR